MIDLTIRAAMCAAGALIATAGVAWFAHYERDVGRAQVQAKWDASKASMNGVVLQRTIDVATTTQQQTAKATKVENHVQDQTKIIALDRVRLMSVNAGLLDTISAVRADSMRTETTRARLAAENAAIADSLGECSGRYTAVATERDELSIQAAGLIELAK